MQTQTLRVAAYFLIAHYLIVTGLTFLGKGTPDLFRVVITLGLLVGAVGALFKPRKLGWLMVVVYAWYAANPFLLGTWVLWASPEAQSSTKIAASIALALFNLPLIVALVLVFKPASFASFRSAPEDDSAQAAKPADIGRSLTRVFGWTAAIVVVVVGAILAVNAFRTAPDDDWLTSAEYQQEFDARLKKGFYPHELLGECRSGGEKFRADWRAIPSGASFLAHHGMTRQDYDRRNGDYLAKGYSLGSLKHFRDCSGMERYQATWLKR